MERKVQILADKLVKLFPDTTVNIENQYFYHGSIDKKSRETYRAYVKDYTFKHNRNSFSDICYSIESFTKLLNKEFGKDEFDTKWSVKS